MRNKRGVLLAIALLALLSLPGLWYLYNQSKATNHAQPEALRQAQSSLPVFYPSKLPDGFSIDQTSVRASADTIIYAITYNRTDKLAVTIQQKPEGVLFDDFYNRILKNKADVFTTHGKAVVGTSGSQTIGSLVTSKEWVLINADKPVDNLAFTQIISSLTPLSK